MSSFSRGAFRALESFRRPCGIQCLTGRSGRLGGSSRGNGLTPARRERELRSLCGSSRPACRARLRITQHDSRGAIHNRRSKAGQHRGDRRHDRRSRRFARPRRSPRHDRRSRPFAGRRRSCGKRPGSNVTPRWVRHPLLLRRLTGGWPGRQWLTRRWFAFSERGRRGWCHRHCTRPRRGRHDGWLQRTSIAETTVHGGADRFRRTRDPSPIHPGGAQWRGMTRGLGPIRDLRPTRLGVAELR
jgi:hypothetical protein